MTVLATLEDLYAEELARAGAAVIQRGTVAYDPARDDWCFASWGIRVAAGACGPCAFHAAAVALRTRVRPPGAHAPS